MLMDSAEFKNRVLGCWMGKNIGGTLGAPFEWKRQINDVSFYTQDLGGEPLPNDDLDIQLLWLVALERNGIHLSAERMADLWCQYVTPHWSEYGTGKVNMRAGLLPPHCGEFRNDFKDSCGAFIRTEIWACIAPGQTLQAVRYAYNDAILDHGHGEGTWAALFIAALESAAFYVHDYDALIQIGLSFIPEDSGVAGAVQCAVDAYKEGVTWQEARDRILRDYRGKAFFGHRWAISQEDMDKGFFDGKLGWDAPSNIGITILGLLYGGDDFGKMMCITVNCGEDTDCTGATAGSIWGILHGFDAIPEKWIAHIGRGIKTITLNLGDSLNVPQTVDELTERTLRQAEIVALTNNKNADFFGSMKPDEKDGTDIYRFLCHDKAAIAGGFPNGPMYRHHDIEVGLDYVDGPAMKNGEDKTIRVRFRNTGNLQANLTLRWYLPDECALREGTCGMLQVLPGWLGDPVEKSYTLCCETFTSSMLRGVLEITAEGRPFVMLVPITLLNGNYFE